MHNASSFILRQRYHQPFHSNLSLFETLDNPTLARKEHRERDYPRSPAINHSTWAAMPIHRVRSRQNAPRQSSILSPFQKELQQ